jgi:membrane-bound lytic murein transglycosylase D
MGLARLARIAGIKTDALAALNPELLKSRLSPEERRWPLKIPADQRARFLQRWSKMRPEVPSHRTYALRFGERLSDVAKRFNTSVKALERLNGLDDTTRLGPGFQLLVPDIPSKPPKLRDPVTVAVPDQEFTYSDRRRIFYRVAHGDRIQAIARFFRIHVDEIARWNSIDPDAKLRRGLILQLYVPQEADLTKALVYTPDEVQLYSVGSEAFFDFHEKQRDRVRIRYRVRPGDTLLTLAERFELSVGSIARINQFSRYTTLQPDQEIILYAPQKSQSQNSRR